MGFEVGQIIEGKVTGITKYGAFVDMGEGKSGMVHISEVSRSFVNDINDHLKIGDTVKAKILTIGDNGKISLSIKQTEPPVKYEGPRGERRPYTPRTPSKPDPTYTWAPSKPQPSTFEDMMNQFKQTSDEKFSDLKRKNPETRRTKRGAAAK